MAIEEFLLTTNLQDAEVFELFDAGCVAQEEFNAP